MNVMVRNKYSVMLGASLLLAVLLQPALAATGGNIYKYVDKDGRTVFGASVPAEYIKNGYTVINDHGQVIQTVPRQATAEEIALIQAAKAAEQKNLNDKVSQAETDKLLIRLYRVPEDITKKRDNAVTQLKTQQDLVKLNLTKTESEIVRVQGIIDNNVKAGREPPLDTKKKMDLARANKDKFEEQLKKIETDREKLIADAERDVKRLQELIGKPDAAGQPASAEKPAAK